MAGEAAGTSRGLRVYKIVVLGDGGVGKSAVTLQFVSHSFLDYHDPTIEDSYQQQAVIDGEPALLDILDTAGQVEFTAMREQYMRCGEGFVLCYSVTDRRSFRAAAEYRRLLAQARPSERLPLVLVGNKLDLAPRFRQIQEQYMRCGEGFVLCYSVTDRRSFRAAAEYRRLLAQARPSERLPLVLVGNKLDLAPRFRQIQEQYMRRGEGFVLCYSVTDRRSFRAAAEYRRLLAQARPSERLPLVLVGNKLDLAPRFRQVSTEEGKALATQLGCPFFETSAALRHFVDDAFHALVREIRRLERQRQSSIMGTGISTGGGRRRWRRLRSIFALVFRRRRRPEP